MPEDVGAGYARPLSAFAVLFSLSASSSALSTFLVNSVTRSVAPAPAPSHPLPPSRASRGTLAADFETHDRIAIGVKDASGPRKGQKPTSQLRVSANFFQ